MSDILDEQKQSYGLTADVNMRFDEDETPLHSAVITGSVEIVQILLNKFAELNSQDIDGKTPLHYSCMVGNLAVTNLLTKRPDIIVNMQDDEGNTPLHNACLSLSDQIITVLLE